MITSVIDIGGDLLIKKILKYRVPRDVWYAKKRDNTSNNYDIFNDIIPVGWENIDKIPFNMYVQENFYAIFDTIDINTEFKRLYSDKIKFGWRIKNIISQDIKCNMTASTPVDPDFYVWVYPQYNQYDGSKAQLHYDEQKDYTDYSPRNYTFEFDDIDFTKSKFAMVFENPYIQIGWRTTIASLSYNYNFKVNIEHDDCPIPAARYKLKYNFFLVEGDIRGPIPLENEEGDPLTYTVILDNGMTGKIRRDSNGIDTCVTFDCNQISPTWCLNSNTYWNLPTCVPPGKYSIAEIWCDQEYGYDLQWDQSTEIDIPYPIPGTTDDTRHYRPYTPGDATHPAKEGLDVECYIFREEIDKVPGVYFSGSNTFRCNRLGDKDIVNIETDLFKYNKIVNYPLSDDKNKEFPDNDPNYLENEKYMNILKCCMSELKSTKSL